MNSMVAYEGPGNSLLYYWEDSNQGSGTETVAGPGTTFSAPAIGLGNNSTGITAEGPEHSLEFYWQTYGGSSGWNEEPAAGNWTTYA
jgi:hypothetical protein